MGRSVFGNSRGSQTTVKLIGADVTIRNSISADDFVMSLEKLSLRLQDFQPVMDEFGQYIVDEHIPRQFDKRGTPERWAALSPAYARRKRALYGNLPILVLSGRMKAGFKYETTKRTLKVVNNVSVGQRGNKTPRWVWHQNGTDRMPARPMVQINKFDRQKLSEIALSYIVGASVVQGGGGL